MYRITRDQAGHEWVKREQFVVSMSESFGIRELEFISGSAVITRADGRVVQQIFNSVEEMSENTISDPDPALPGIDSSSLIPKLSLIETTNCSLFTHSCPA